eukprot:7159634-Prorocentrum_lima.AAC.1
MTSSLVGSEMCIRDSYKISQIIEVMVGSMEDVEHIHKFFPDIRNVGGPVSYTHLTLPTICSV